MAEKQDRSVHCSCRLLMLLGVAALLVTLVGLAMTAVEGFFMGGLQNNVQQLEATNQKLKQQNAIFQKNNADLQYQINNLTAINKQLNLEVNQYTHANAQMSQTLQSLNESDLQLIQQVNGLQDLTEDLSSTVHDLKNKTESLEGDIDDLKAASEKLNTTLSNLEKIRDELNEFDQKNNDDFKDAMATTMGLFKNLTTNIFQNQQTFFDGVANDVEFLDGGENYDPHEYNIFLNQISNLTQYTTEELNQTYPYDKVKGSDVEMTYADISTLINEIIKSEKASWNVNNAVTVALHPDRSQFDDFVAQGSIQKEQFVAELRKLLFHI